MKIITKTKLISVFLGLLLVFMTGSELFGQVVDRGRYYCPIHDEIYSIAGEHGSQCSATRTAPPAEEVVLLYCRRCNTKYPKGTKHTCPVPPPVVVSTRPQSSFLGSETRRKYRTDRRSFVDIDILAVQRPQRYGIYRNYGGYGGYGYGRNYYNLSGRNYLRKWFGKDHHHRDHHEPQRHRHRDHHRGWGGYGGYGGRGW